MRRETYMDREVFIALAQAFARLDRKTPRSIHNGYATCGGGRCVQIIQRGISPVRSFSRTAGITEKESK